jgi:hypothetical protein
VLKTVLEKHADEIRTDRKFAKAVFAMVVKKATPQQLRRLAARDRENGNIELAYYSEMIADQRERGEWTSSVCKIW